MDSKYHSIFEIDNFYHVFNRSINEELLFASERNYKYFLDRFDKYIIPYVDIISYCLMPTHFHFLIRIKSFDSDQVNFRIINQFKRLFASYTLSYNAERKRHGSLFQKSFKRIIVDDESYFTNLIHYIHHNPIHHHVSTCYSEWKYSSYNAIISDKSTKVVKDLVLDWFGGKDEFCEFHKINIKYENISKILFDES